VLEDLTDAGTGWLAQAASENDLKTRFKESAQAIKGQLLVTAPLPATIQPGQFNVLVQATVGAGTELLSDAALLLLDQADLPPPSVQTGAGHRRQGSSTPIPRWRQGGPAVRRLGHHRRFRVRRVRGQPAGADVRRRMAQYSMANPMARESSGGRTGGRERQRLGHPARGLGIARSAVELAERVVVSRDTGRKLAARLEAAAVPLRPAEWVLLHAASAIVPSFLLLLLSDGDLPLSMLALLAGAVTPYLYLTAKQSAGGRSSTSSYRPRCSCSPAASRPATRCRRRWTRSHARRRSRWRASSAGPSWSRGSRCRSRRARARGPADR
jgi:tight adherence protein B